MAVNTAFSQHFALEYDHPANLGSLFHFGDAIGPVGIEGLQVLAPPFDDQLFEVRFI
jgi:hypothetical protein